MQSLTQHSEPSVTSDERILRAVKYVNDHLSAPLTLKQVAGVACLSPSRFRHLFAEQTGMGLRQYILWRRFVSVWELRMNGASLVDRRARRGVRGLRAFGAHEPPHDRDPAVVAGCFRRRRAPKRLAQRLAVSFKAPDRSDL